MDAVHSSLRSHYMHETEIKAINIDRKAIVEKLTSLGAKKSFEGEIRAVFFDFEDSSIRKASKLLRLEEKGGKVLLTFKSPLAGSSAKITEEAETEVSDFGKMKEILESMGLKQWRAIRKSRVSYKLGNTTFELDKYHDELDFIPEFMEIEVLSENYEEAMKIIFEYADKLGIPGDNCKPWDLDKLIGHYSKD